MPKSEVHLPSKFWLNDKLWSSIMSYLHTQDYITQEIINYYLINKNFYFNKGRNNREKKYEHLLGSLGEIVSPNLQYYLSK